MAQRKFAIDVGQHDSQVVITTGSGMTAGLELQVDDTKCVKKEDAIILLTEMVNRIQEGVWPPVNS
ncbi:hypothetical protein D9M71_712110 [compost metagenome]